MRPIIPICFVASIVIYGCCQEACVDESLNINLQGFELSDVDTVRFTAYHADGKFENPTHTIEFYGNPFFLGADAVHSDWLVTVPATDKSYRISSIRTGLADCQCESGSYHTIKGYDLDGVDTSASEVLINK